MCGQLAKHLSQLSVLCIDFWLHQVGGNLRGLLIQSFSNEHQAICWQFVCLEQTSDIPCYRFGLRSNSPDQAEALPFRACLFQCMIGLLLSILNIVPKQVFDKCKQVPFFCTVFNISPTLFNTQVILTYSTWFLMAHTACD